MSTFAQATPIPLPLLDGNTLLCDNSSMEKFTTCPRSAQYTLCRKLRTAGERSALKFGGITHKVLEARYRIQMPMLEQTPSIEASMLAVAEKEFAEYTPPEDDFRTFDTMSKLIVAYGLKYRYEDFTIVTFPDGTPFIEVPFMVPLGTINVSGPLLIQRLVRSPDGTIHKKGIPEYVTDLATINLVWTGRIDLVYTTPTGGLYLMDHKTSSIATNMAEFEISHQFYGYCHAVESLLGREVTGTVINRIVCRKPTRTGEAFTFERKLIPIQRGLVTEWRMDVLHIIADFIQMVQRGYLPKHTSWCVGKFGTCEFHKVCTLDTDEQREVMLGSGEYEENTWSPLST